MIDGQAQREVKTRIMGVLFSDEIPDPRDVMIICLADACGIFGELLSKEELAQASARIGLLHSAQIGPYRPSYVQGDL